MSGPTVDPIHNAAGIMTEPRYPAQPHSPTEATFSTIDLDKKEDLFTDEPRRPPSLPLSIPPRFQLPPRPSAQRRKHHVMRFWLWEISALLSALVLMGVTIFLPAYYSGKRLPQLPYSVSLNALITLFAVLLRAAISVAVASVISQAKWSWFAQPRPLSHLGEFDWASRSVVGSARLLFIAPGSLWGVVGSVLTIVSLGIGPLAQQAVKTVACPQHLSHANSSVPLAHYVPGRSSLYGIGSGLWELQVDMKGAMINGLVNPTGNDTSVTAWCQTGNCTFPISSEHVTHSSIGMCSVCTDTTSLATSSVRGNYTLPNGLWVNSGNSGTYLNVKGDSNLTWATPALTDELINVASGSLVNVTIFAVTQAVCTNTDGSNCSSGKGDYTATTCALYPCLKNYHSRVKRGVLEEQVISTQPATTVANNPLGSGETKGNYTALKMPCVVDRIEYDFNNVSTIPQIPGRRFTSLRINNTNVAAPEECLYKLSGLYGSAISRFMNSDLFSGRCTHDPDQGDFLYCGGAWWLSPLYHSRLANFDTISNAIDQFTTALTNKFRTTGGSNYDALAEEVVHGSVVEIAVCTVFDGRWLVMPVALVIITTLYWTLMVMKNYAEPWLPVWKDSLLPLLFYGLGTQRPPPIERSPRVLDLAHVDRAAEKIRATFFSTGVDAGWVDEGRARR